MLGLICIASKNTYRKTRDSSLTTSTTTYVSSEDLQVVEFSEFLPDSVDRYTHSRPVVDLVLDSDHVEIAVTARRTRMSNGP